MACRYHIASDIIRDGLGVELHRAGKVIAEILEVMAEVLRKTRIEAFSDSVIAITMMLLELKIPHNFSFSITLPALHGSSVWYAPLPSR